MSDTTKHEVGQGKSGLRIPGFAQLQRLGKSLMLPIAVLPAAGILLRLGQDDLLGRIQAHRDLRVPRDLLRTRKESMCFRPRRAKSCCTLR